MPKTNNGVSKKLRDETGKWEIIWFEKGRRKRKSTGTSDPKQADKFLAIHLATIAAQEQRHATTAPTERFLGMVIADYLEEQRPQCTAKGQVTMTTALKPIIAWWGDKTVSDVTKANCQAYAKFRGKLAAARQELAYFKAALMSDWRNKRIAHQVPVWMPSPPNPRTRWLNRREAAALVRAARNGLACDYLPDFILLAIYTGARSAALLGLKWEQVDFSQGLIHLDPIGKQASHKKGATIPFNVKIEAVLRRRQKRGLKDGYVLHENQRQIGSIKRSFKTACKAAGLGNDVTPHTLRHTTASWLVQAGLPIFDVAQYLGHSSPAMVAKHYGHLSPSHLAAASSVLARRPVSNVTAHVTAQKKEGWIMKNSQPVVNVGAGKRT